MAVFRDDPQPPTPASSYTPNICLTERRKTKRDRKGSYAVITLKADSEEG